MTWWRRDSSLWIRTPIHRYVRSVVSENDNALRSRCFSRSQPPTQDHEHNHANRSSGLSEYERMRLKHYKLWKRRIEADPYKALFGASESMLNGKGLKHWRSNDSISDWLSREAALDNGNNVKAGHEKPSSPYDSYRTLNPTQASTTSKRYRREGDMTRDEIQNWDIVGMDSSNYGVDSPSDSRRPREPSHTSKSGGDKNLSAYEVGEVEYHAYGSSKTSNNMEQHSTRDQRAEAFKTPNDTRPTRKSSFVDEFLTSDQRKDASQSSPSGDSPRVLRTSLEQRESQDFGRKPRRPKVFSAANFSSEQTYNTKPEQANGTTNPTNRSGAQVQDNPLDATSATFGSLSRSDSLSNPVESVDAEAKGKSNRPKATRDIHQLLPEDDIDFLTADSIRSSMGRIKHPQKDNSEVRQKMERKYEDTHQKDQLDQLLEWKVLNDQHIRRTEREFHESQTPVMSVSSKTVAVSPPEKNTVAEDIENHKKTADPRSQASALENGFDYMMNWLQAGGNFMAQQFFQDPVDVLANQERLTEGVSSDPFFKNIVSGIEKGRRATSQVKLDIVQDIPASKSLVDRLTNNETSVMRAAGIISGTIPAARNERENKDGEGRVRVLRRGLLATEEDFKAACKTVDLLDTSTPASGALARRLRVAADVLRKNAKLTRVMIFGLQTRLENVQMHQPSLQSRDLVHRLLALQDTQLALVRVVSRLMQVYGVNPKVEVNMIKKDQTGTVEDQPAATEHASMIEVEKKEKDHEIKAAADAKLADEIDNLKTAMRGLSDDGYSRAPKPTIRRSFDNMSPLSHSLFRPFRLQLDSLGTNNNSAMAEFEKKKADKELVKEVKSIYEEQFGPITIQHRQDPNVEENAIQTSSGEASNDGVSSADSVAEAPSTLSESRSTEQKPPTLQPLKEDEVSPTVSSACQPSPMQEQTVSPVLQQPTDDLTTSQSPTTTVDIAESSPPSPPPTATQELISTTHIYIYIHDPTTDEMTITPSNPPPSQSTQDTTDASPPIIPLYTALGALTDPSKFLPHLPNQQHTYEILSARPNLLAVRMTTATFHALFPPALTANANANANETIRIPATTSPSPTSTKPLPDPQPSDPDTQDTTPPGSAPEWTPTSSPINPIDGTTRLSPTGFTNPSSLDLDLERDDFEERRRAAGEQHSSRLQYAEMAARAGPHRFPAQASVGDGGEWREFPRGEEQDKQARKIMEREERGKRRGGFAGVVRCVVVAGAWCYVVGVLAEVVR